MTYLYHQLDSGKHNSILFLLLADYYSIVWVAAAAAAEISVGHTTRRATVEF